MLKMPNGFLFKLEDSIENSDLALKKKGEDVGNVYFKKEYNEKILKEEDFFFISVANEQDLFLFKNILWKESIDPYTNEIKKEEITTVFNHYRRSLFFAVKDFIFLGKDKPNCIMNKHLRLMFNPDSVWFSELNPTFTINNSTIFYMRQEEYEKLKEKWNTI